MSKTKLTPGPCSICHERGLSSELTLNGVRFACDNQDTEEAHIDDYPIYDAAPDLLSSCKEMLEANYMPGSTMEIAVRAAAAIAKATA